MEEHQVVDLPTTRAWHVSERAGFSAPPGPVAPARTPWSRFDPETVELQLRAAAGSIRRRLARARRYPPSLSTPLDLVRRWIRAHPRRRRLGRDVSLTSGDGWTVLTPRGFRQVDDRTTRRADELDIERSSRARRRAVAARAVVIGEQDPSEDGVSCHLLRLGLLGAPLVDGAERPGTPTGRLGEVVADVHPTSMSDPHRREQHSVALRRAARRDAEDRGLLVPWSPSLTVLLATNRPPDLEHALAAIARQSTSPTEVVIGLHGPGWTASDDRRIHDALDCAVDVVRCDASMNLGQVLQILSDRASGDVLTKWDDDDWYGRHHLEDLVDALRYSGADIVGKAAEFVRLEAVDLTIRRFAVGAETASRTLAGGTLIFRRSTLESAGGWAPVPRHVDRELIDAVVRAGGSVYRTHGFGYLLRRSADHHTWTADDGYFLRHASAVRPGLDLDFSGCDD